MPRAGLRARPYRRQAAMVLLWRILEIEFIRRAQTKNPRGDTPPALQRQILSGSSPLAAINPRCRGRRLFNPPRRGTGRVPADIRRTQTRPRYSMHHWSWSVQPSYDRALELLAHKIAQGCANSGEVKREVAEAAGNGGGGREGTAEWGQACVHRGLSEPVPSRRHRRNRTANSSGDSSSGDGFPSRASKSSSGAMPC